MKCDDYHCNKEATHEYKLKHKNKTLHFCDEHYQFAMSLIGIARGIKDSPEVT